MPNTITHPLYTVDQLQSIIERLKTMENQGTAARLDKLAKEVMDVDRSNNQLEDKVMAAIPDWEETRDEISRLNMGLLSLKGDFDSLRMDLEALRIKPTSFSKTILSYSKESKDTEDTKVTSDTKFTKVSKVADADTDTSNDTTATKDGEEGREDGSKDEDRVDYS
jgi:chromosome segregation ATPase